jgi:hypothetical protein
MIVKSTYAEVLGSGQFLWSTHSEWKGFGDLGNPTNINEHQLTSTNINEHQRTSTNINQHQLTSTKPQNWTSAAQKKKWNWGFSPQKGYCHQKPSGFGGSTNLRWSQPGLPQKVILCYKTVSPKIQQLGGAGSTWLVVDICWHPLPAFFA